MGGLDRIDAADCLVVQARGVAAWGRCPPAVRWYWEQGRPVVAIGFGGHDAPGWRVMVRDVFGAEIGPSQVRSQRVLVRPAASALGHPVLQGVAPLISSAGLRFVATPSEATVPLLIGTSDDHTEPVAWIRACPGGQSFLTSLGHPADFREPSFRRLLVNAVLAAARP